MKKMKEGQIFSCLQYIMYNLILFFVEGEEEINWLKEAGYEFVVSHLTGNHFITQFKTASLTDSERLTAELLLCIYIYTLF